jgi:hypothetical protein
MNPVAVCGFNRAESLAKRENNRDGIKLNDDARDGLHSLSERYEIPLPDGLS